MATYFRRDDDVQNGLGEAVPNIAVTYYVQPGLTLATCYADPLGVTPIANPQYTNGLGQTAVYLLPGLYTITYSGAQIQTLTYPDQLVSAGSSSTRNNPVVPTPAFDGTTRIFTIPVTPVNANSDQWFVGRTLAVYGTDYTVAGKTITWIAVTPPQTGDTSEYFVS